jgi:acetolactate synthase-1/2/3 large subunit
VRRALVIARSGRPGPVRIDIPKDVTARTADYEPKPPLPNRPSPCLRAEDVEEAARLIAQAEKPLIFAGGGVVISGASAELAALAERIDAPVCLSMPGITALPKNHPRNLGMIGMHGTPVSNRAASQCDLLIAVGTRFSDRVTGGQKNYAPHAKKIQIDIDSAENGKNLIPDLFLEADAKDALGRLAEAADKKKNDEWMHRLIRFKALNPLPEASGRPGVDTRDVLKAVGSLAGEDAVLVTDVGQHQMITVQYYRFRKPRSFISSCGLGTMGYGMGAAVGAKLAAPDCPVILITSDGSFHMNMAELATAVTEQLPITVLIMNNGVLGMVRQWQKLFYGSRFSATTPNRKTDFVKLAEAMGAQGFALNRKADIPAVLKQALSCSGPCVVDCSIDRDDNVFPIIPPGKGEEDMIYFD